MTTAIVQSIVDYNEQPLDIQSAAVLAYGLIPPPSHDIFDTPENRLFYSSRPYTRLDPTRKEIRLLKVLLGDDTDGMIQCNLLP